MTRRALLAVLCAAGLISGSLPGAAAAAESPAIHLENLDRGLVAATTTEGMFLSWRLLGPEATGHSATGLTGVDFAVYRNGRRIATVTDSTNYLDKQPVSSANYRVAPLVGGVEGERSKAATPFAGGQHDLPLRKPPDGVTPVGEKYTYAVNDLSVGDVDGDGSYEYVVKWDPSNSKDVSQVGYTGTVLIDTYELDGTLRNRIDLGVNIRAGAHYTQFLVYDFDGDGRSEMMLKTAPGTRSIRYDKAGNVVSQKYITMPRADARAGYTNDDDYRLSAAGYREHLVTMFRNWPRHPEVVAGRWPATIEQALGLPPNYDDAEKLVDYFIDVYAPSRSARNNLRAFEGFVLDGPEYLTVFDGASGRELQTVAYQPGRHDDGLMWGDYAMARIEPGNRVDRFLAGVAYLDGRHPSAVFARGYYTRTNLVAYRWNGRKLVQDWYVNSGWVPMSNPFNDAPHGKDGTDPKLGKLASQGFHSLSASDVDGDGRQEIVFGSATVDDDGSLLYSSYGVLPEGSAAPGQTAKLGHGDAMHVTDVDPDRPGLETFTVHESATSAPYGMAMRDAATGSVLFGTYSGRDTGRGMIGDVLPGERGLESWASLPGGTDSLGLRSATGKPLPGPIPGTNMSIRWAGDLTTQVVNGAGDVTPTVDDWRRGTLVRAVGTLANNGTKGNPGLVADILGDWREELLLRTADSSAIRIYLSTEVTGHKLYTLMHDPQYRVEVARQQTTYNQPSYPSFYLASDTDWSRVPLPGGRR
jgi:hypothetical protein